MLCLGATLIQDLFAAWWNITRQLLYLNQAAVTEHYAQLCKQLIVLVIQRATSQKLGGSFHPLVSMTVFTKFA